uniref:Uncharacterized protein n=1 Tax=viral metagenome TaxID=1070528 RepID=A0A6C0IVE3_9ZZZZ
MDKNKNILNILLEYLEEYSDSLNKNILKKKIISNKLEKIYNSKNLNDEYIKYVI